MLRKFWFSATNCHVIFWPWVALSHRPQRSSKCVSPGAHCCWCCLLCRVQQHEWTHPQHFCVSLQASDRNLIHCATSTCRQQLIHCGSTCRQHLIHCGSTCRQQLNTLWLHTSTAPLIVVTAKIILTRRTCTVCACSVNTEATRAAYSVLRQ